MGCAVAFLIVAFCCTMERIWAKQIVRSRRQGGVNNHTVQRLNNSVGFIRSSRINTTCAAKVQQKANERVFLILWFLNKINHACVLDWYGNNNAEEQIKRCEEKRRVPLYSLQSPCYFHSIDERLITDDNWWSIAIAFDMFRRSNEVMK